MGISEREPNTASVPRIGRSVSIAHAAELLGMSERTVYARIREGFLETIRTPNGSQRVLIESLEFMFRITRTADEKTVDVSSADICKE